MIAVRKCYTGFLLKYLLKPKVAPPTKKRVKLIGSGMTVGVARNISSSVPSFPTSLVKPYNQYRFGRILLWYYTTVAKKDFGIISRPVKK